jgi:hypothetical protein
MLTLYRMFATRGDLKNACLEILTLAAQLKVSGDMMAVFCMADLDNSRDHRLSDSCEIYSLQPPNIRILARKLKQISRQQPQSASNPRGAILHAVEVLSKLSGISDIARDIIVISPNQMDTIACCKDIGPSFRTHLFNPGTVPYGDVSHVDYDQQSYHPSVELMSGENSMRGSPSLYPDLSTSIGWVLDAAQCITGHCRKHQSHSLQDVIAYCRAQPHSGSISNLSISFQPRPDAVLENILGNLEHPILFPGQVISLMVQVRLKSLKPLLSRNDSPASSENSCARSISEAISDLEMTMGEHLSELFDVQVRYEHSLFPGNTQLLAHDTCWLRRILSTRQKRSNKDLQDSVVRERVHVRSSVQKQLALCLANLENPREALESLEAMFRSKRVTTSCLELIETIKGTLKYRNDLSALEDGSYGQPSPNCGSTLLSPMLPLSPYHHLSPYEAERQDRVSEIERRFKHSSESPATVVRRNVAAMPEVDASNEAARKIWQHIRKTSRPKKELAEERTGYVEAQEHSLRHIEEIKKTVLRNQRKMSAETLKSLARDIRHVSGDLGDGDEVDD